MLLAFGWHMLARHPIDPRLPARPSALVGLQDLRIEPEVLADFPVRLYWPAAPTPHKFLRRPLADEPRKDLNR